MPFAPSLGCLLPATLYLLDQASALHALPLSPLCPDEPPTSDGGDGDGMAASRELWRFAGPPELHTVLTTVLPREVHALAVLAGGDDGVPPLALLGDQDGVRLVPLTKSVAV